MSEHREWDLNITNRTPIGELRNEHNATVRAYRDAMAELERIGKINDSMCDTIADLEREVRTVTEHADRWSTKVRRLESRLVLTWEECEAKIDDISGTGGLDVWERYERFRNWLKSRLPAPTDSIRVPFSDAQIEAMARAAHDCRNFRDEQFPQPNWETLHDDLKAKWCSAIRAALAAGGLAPCPAPEYAPEDVALRPERASDEELALAGRNAYELASGFHAYSLFDEMSYVAKVGELASARAVRARVEAPLLAEIERLNKSRINYQAEALRQLTERQSVYAERDTLRAELEAIRELCNDNEARAAFAHIGAPARPEGMPSVEELAELVRESISWYEGFENEGDEIETIVVTGHDAAARAILAALTPWLREPTGWELDVTAEEMEEAREKYTYDEYNTPNWEMLQWLRSRIRPTFECAECAGKTAKLKALDDAIAQLAARAALEGE